MENYLLINKLFLIDKISKNKFNININCNNNN